MARIDVDGIPEWTLRWIDQYCDRNGTKRNQLIRDYLVDIAKSERDSITLSGTQINKYKNLCQGKGITAEVALSLHIQNVINRKGR